MKNIFFILLIGLISPIVIAQKAKKIKGDVTEPLEDSYNVGEFKEDLLRKAQISALAKEFGTNLSANTDLQLTNTATELNSLNTSTVKGEWIKTDEVEYVWHLTEENNQQRLYLSCHVEGRGRKLETPTLDFNAKTLNCPQSNCETTMFNDMQNFYVSFKTPKQGYISIYMRENDKVYRLFPYSTMQGEAMNPYAVNADKEYIFFDPRNASAFENVSNRQVDELMLSTMGAKRIFNRLYVVFCPTEYDKPILHTEEGGIKTLSPLEFQEWLSLQKTNKKGFQEKIIYFKVEK